MTATAEIALTLRVAPEHFAQLARHPRLRGARTPDTRRVHAVYFDTATQDLWHAGLALQVRREREGWIQTMEGLCRAQAVLPRGIEMSAAAAGPAPDLGGFPPGPWTGTLLAAIAGKPLAPVCIVRYTRSTRLLQGANGATIEASLDRGDLHAGRARVSLRELELKSGSPDALYALARILVGSAPLALEYRSKVERGYALRMGEAETPVKAAAIALTPDMTAGDAFITVLRAVSAHLQANAAGAQRHGDPEWVHQARVALRRLRSAFSVFQSVIDPERKAALVAEMRWLARALGAVRDWDVFLETAYAPACAAFPDHAGLEACGRAFRQRQRLASRQARRALGSVRYQRLVLALGACLSAQERPGAMAPELAAALGRRVIDHAAVALEARYARMRKRGRRYAERTPEELHGLRIEAKKLRYAAHFFAGLHEDARTRPLLARLSALQDALGALNDALCAHALVACAPPAGAADGIAEARGILLAWSRGRADLLHREAERAWRAVRRCPTFW